MIVKMKVKSVGQPDSEAWEEEIDSDNTRCLSHAARGLEPVEYAEMVVEFFNSTLKPGETERVVVSAEAV